LCFYSSRVEKNDRKGAEVSTKAQINGINLMETPLEYILTTFNKKEMMAWLEAHPESFEEAILLAIADKPTYSWRAAWLLWSCMKDNDPRIRPFISGIIKCMDIKRDGHQRELLKILYLMDLSEEQEGLIFDLCMNVWEEVGKAPSVRHNAFRMIVRIASKYPELSSEIALITQNHYMETLSPGVRKAVMKMIV
jgi:hypothetical protein